MKLIPLTQGKFTQVDDKNFDWLNQWKWHAHSDNGNYYAIRSYKVDNKIVVVRMHRLILGLTDPFVFGDHEDGDGLNNQEFNLRPANRSQNSSNRAAKKNGTSAYLGVHLRVRKYVSKNNIIKYYYYWIAQIYGDGKTVNLGQFNIESDAAKAYNVAAKKYHGDFANLNIII